MTCKECLHGDVCEGYMPTDLNRDVWHYCREGRADQIPDIEERCSSFKDSTNYVEVVRCKDCKHFKPAHFKADDGTETPWDETFNWDDRSDGIYHGGKCKHDRNTAYGQKDMAFRKPDDFCSYGERREGE